MVSISSLIVSAILGASFAAAAPAATINALTERASNVIIGYRTVSAVSTTRSSHKNVPNPNHSQTQAADYNKQGTVTFTGNQISAQTGAGVYTTYDGSWAGSSTDWYCVIMADSAKLQTISKAWIPESSTGGVKIWYASDTVIDNFIKGLDSTITPSKTLRMSVISGDSNRTLQMSIPSALLGKNGPLGITATCKATKSEIPSTKVSYTSFTKVYGVAQS